ncbi:hypothetical protein [Saccharopolyspora gregorii]|uniref:Uncharacterized protein n=1 Tax=Saccharopolyspora gregorii TaxID=33914 RepID=A0ABP6RJ56_9PSEU
MSAAYFQYRQGVVSQSHRVAHCAFGEFSEADSAWFSWCRREFPSSLIEITAKPGEPPGSGQAQPCSPCVQCLLLLTAAVEVQEDTSPPVRGLAEKSVAVIMRKAQWMLDDAAVQVSKGACGSAEYAELATTLGDLARLMQDKAEEAQAAETSND